MLLLNALNRRDATVFRLVGLALISWTIFNSKFAPATSGRGLVVLITLAVAIVAWLVWTFWSCRVSRMTPDVYVLALAGGLLATADLGSAASAFVFVAATVTGVRIGLIQGLSVAALGAATLAAGAIIYDNSGLGVLAYALGFAALALAGSNLRQLNLRTEQAELLLAQTQRSHEEHVRTARLEESARIARNIHDVLAHSLAGLSIQLEATDALLAQGADTETIRERIQRAHELAREGLRETRRAVGALRGDPVILAPAAIAGLVDEFDGTIEFKLIGDETRLEGEVGETAVRTIQEALTNVRKHASGAEVEVAVIVAPDGVDVVVEDRLLAPITASSLAGTGGGYGLRGMRERAAPLGGTLTAGPTPDGWRVALHLPLRLPLEGSS
jgi:signal transduction histidine kinase